MARPFGRPIRPQSAVQKTRCHPERSDGSSTTSAKSKGLKYHPFISRLLLGIDSPSHEIRSAKTILNFVLARIASIAWFQDQFLNAVAAINERANELIQGAVSEEDCGQLLLKIFPERMRRNNTGMLTFLKTYFSDGEGDRASFYPRIYDSFLRFIAEGGSSRNVAKRTQLEGGLVAHDLIFEAHAQACKDYLEQVKDELKNLLNLASTLNENKQRISEMLASFNGMTTPFEIEPCIRQLFTRLNETVQDSALRQAMQQMKKIGIFEDRPSYPGHWRVGRLFKSSLGMRYNRKRKGED
jgi:hypothetical protein